MSDTKKQELLDNMSKIKKIKELNLNESINYIQTRMDVFTKKSAKNEMGKGYKYFTETDLFNALKPLLEETKITYLIMLNEDSQLNPLTQIGNMWMFQSKAYLKLAKGNEVQMLPIFITALNTDSAKAMGSALTYGLRYWLCKIFGIATDELDPDTTALSNEVKHNSKKIVKASITDKDQVVKKPNTQQDLVIELMNESKSIQKIINQNVTHDNFQELFKLIPAEIKKEIKKEIEGIK